jgi:hypothetical protein
MFAINVRILETMKNFVSMVCTQREVLQRFCLDPKAFMRRRKLPFDHLVVLILKLCKKTLSVELDHFFQDMNPALNCSVSAFTQQRLKLNPLFFYFWNRVLWASYYMCDSERVQRYKGYRIVAADGSSVSLINNEALREHFGSSSNQISTFVVAKTFYHYDVLNELVLSGHIGPYRYGELNMAYDAMEEVQEDMLMIYDRNFCNYKMVALHLWQEKERKFVIRAKENLRIVKAFIKSGEASSVVQIKPSDGSIEGLRKSGYIIKKDTLLTVRLVRVELTGSVEVLMTNLWQHEGHDNEVFKGLYFMRWGVETNISIQKNIMQLESFSGLSVEAVLQDFYATVLMANLHSIIIKEAQQSVEKSKKQRKYPMKININKSFGKLKEMLVTLFRSPQPEGLLQKLHDYFAAHILPIRKGRSFPRKRKNTHLKSKFKTFSNFKPAY